MQVSLIVTTYNWAEALELVLLSALNQSELPAEIIIADDGSRKDTKDLIEQYQIDSIVPIIHSWQEDDGFRAAQSRNRAIAKSTSEYIVLVDGDMILHPDFVKEHKKFAKHGCFIQGSRVLIGEKKSSFLIKDKQILISIMDRDIKNRLNALHSTLLTSLFLTQTQSHKGIKTCNMSFYKDDCYTVNGFNNDFVGWGREDSEFVVRLYNSGLKRLNIKFSAIAYHIWHEENSRKSLTTNDEILAKSMENNLVYCQNGIDNY